MNKLKNKVFWVILSILTIFLISILLIFNFQDYSREKNNIENNLNRMGLERDKVDNRKFDMAQGNEQGKHLEENKNANLNSKVFMDYIVYVVTINENYEIDQIINHSQDSQISNELIRNIAQNIINNNQRGNSKIGNLYFENYSYSFRKNGIIIIDNSQAKERLLSTLKTSLLIFILLEAIIIYVSRKLTKWIIKPVEESFNKQKQFIADASHELKTPLAVIIASSEAFEKEPTEKKWLNNIKSEAERMNDLISDLLDMAKSENVNKQEYVKEDLSKLIERSILTFESLIYEKNIKLDYKIDEDIAFICNSNQIKQLIGILIDNAIKYSTKEEGEISISLKKDKSNIVLSVKNKGKEISKEQQEKIFERFYRVDESRNRSENRYGLGLAIAKNIVENHNGEISVNSYDGYNNFTIVFKQI